MRRIWTRLLLLLLLLALLAGTTFAGEVTLGLRFRPIESGVFATDSMYGVSANYQLGSTIYCSELIARYYQTLYGVEVMVGDGPYVANSDTYWFEPTTTPTAGDVVYAAPAKRGKSYAHYALDKYANAEDNIVTLMEQNWSWNGGAAYERSIPYSDDCHVFYTLRCKTGKAKMTLPEADTVSAWAKEAVAEADTLGITEGLVAGYRRTITRGVLARLCVNAAEHMGLLVDQSNPYGAACALGIMEKREDGEFAPWEAVSRAEAASVFARLLDCIGTVPEAAQSVLQSVTDVKALTAEGKDAVALMLATGLMQTENGSFRPDAALTTEQAISVLVQLVNDPTPQVRSNAAAERQALPLGLGHTASRGRAQSNLI